MKKSSFCICAVALMLVVASSASATKYYFNSVDSSSTAGWTGNAANPAGSVLGAYKWAGGSYGNELMYANASDANKGCGWATSATPAATVAEDFWISADFRHTGLYAGNGAGGYKRAWVFFVDNTGAGLGVHAAIDRVAGTVTAALVYTANFTGLPTGAAGAALISEFSVDTTLDSSNWDDIRISAEYVASNELVNIYVNGNLVRTGPYEDIPTWVEPGADIARNFTKVGTWFFNDFNEVQYANVAVDNIWLGSTANPYVNATLLNGDINGDLIVDVVDLGLLATSWKKGNATWNGALDSALNPGTKIMGWNAGDFNGDTTVDVVDLGLLATNWKKSIAAPVQPTPEPATMALLGFAGLGLLARRKR